MSVTGDEGDRARPGVPIKRKGTVPVRFHCRTASDAVPTPGGLEALADRHGLVVAPGRMAGEIRAPVGVDKGTALTLLLDDRPVQTCAFAGDDHGDLPAFAALTDRTQRQPGFAAVRIAVRSPELPT